MLTHWSQLVLICQATTEDIKQHNSSNRRRIGTVSLSRSQDEIVVTTTVTVTVITQMKSNQATILSDSYEVQKYYQMPLKQFCMNTTNNCPFVSFFEAMAISKHMKRQYPTALSMCSLNHT